MKTAALFAVLALSTSAASAAVITTGNTPGGDNVVFNPCTAPVLGPSLTIEGCLNTAHTTNVLGTGVELLVANGGQARFEALDGGFNQITIEFASALLDFSQLVLNIKTTTDGVVNFSATGASFTTATSWAISSTGQNFFTLLADVGESFHSVTLTTTVNIADIRQVRLVPVDAAPVPEPASFALMGLGLAALGWARRRH